MNGLLLPSPKESQFIFKAVTHYQMMVRYGYLNINGCNYINSRRNTPENAKGPNLQFSTLFNQINREVNARTYDSFRLQ